jgi:hypothetical protein
VQAKAAARARVGGPRGWWHDINRTGGRLGVRATPGKACAARTQARPGSDSSPARGRTRGGG